MLHAACAWERVQRYLRKSHKSHKSQDYSLLLYRSLSTPIGALISAALDVTKSAWKLERSLHPSEVRRQAYARRVVRRTIRE